MNSSECAGAPKSAFSIAYAAMNEPGAQIERN